MTALSNPFIDPLRPRTRKDKMSIEVFENLNAVEVAKLIDLGRYDIWPPEMTRAGFRWFFKGERR